MWTRHRNVCFYSHIENSWVKVILLSGEVILRLRQKTVLVCFPRAPEGQERPFQTVSPPQQTFWRLLAMREKWGEIRWAWSEPRTPILQSPGHHLHASHREMCLRNAELNRLLRKPCNHTRWAVNPQERDGGCAASLTTWTTESFPTERPLSSRGILRKTPVCGRVFWK